MPCEAVKLLGTRCAELHGIAPAHYSIGDRTKEEHPPLRLVYKDKTDFYKRALKPDPEFK